MCFCKGISLFSMQRWIQCCCCIDNVFNRLYWKHPNNNTQHILFDQSNNSNSISVTRIIQNGREKTILLPFSSVDKQNITSTMKWTRQKKREEFYFYDFEYVVQKYFTTVENFMAFSRCFISGDVWVWKLKVYIC